MATGIRHRPQMDSSDFEELAAHAPEHVTLEFINGRIGVKPVPDGDHAEIIRWVMQRCMQQRPDLWLYAEQGLRVEEYRRGHARPDGALAPVDTFAGQGEWAEPRGVLMVVEITSYDEDTDRRDRVEKPIAYAQADIPVYLLIDRDSCDVTVFSEPEDGKYRTSLTVAFGHTVALPGLDITLDTEAFKNYVR
ncbi:Uma2 family endonuclease [Streptomyces sp. NPDC001315]|uniref:Uma2 family endonuclease n=1 Tax=Streptomyces sp. NPDC001315 TaxID=3364562 RepID=UPI00369A1873